MDLQNNLRTETGWEIIEKSFDPDQYVTTGSNFMIGNGYLGYRGTFAEWEADQFVACVVTDTWDQAPESRWSELCTVPNGLYTRLFMDDESLSAFERQPEAYHRSLDLRYGVNRRAQIWRNGSGKGIQIEVEKFSSYDNLHLIPMRYHLTALDAVEITILTGIDGCIWSLNGDHFKDYDLLEDSGLIAIETRTIEHEIQIDVVEGLKILGVQPTQAEIIREDRRILRKLTFDLQAGETVTFEKVMLVCHSNQVDNPRETALAEATDALETGYQNLKAAHQSHWDQIWAISDIQIAGNLEVQTITRFNLYQATIATPAHTKLPIGARGLSCQVYQGAAFWDQETFNMPMYLYTRPEVARNIIEYRYDTLPGARKKAQRLGYYGAFYAWTSGKTGEELFPNYFFTDVLTGRKIHNHFNSWQIHISPDVVYALWLYYEVTGDWDFMLNYGAEIAFEVAQFLVSHIYFKKDKQRYEFIRLLGPDEYHENVDNNAYTNYLAKYALEKAVQIFGRMQSEAPNLLSELLERLGYDETVLDDWVDIVELIFLPEPDPKTRLIEQFDGFFQLEDITPADLRQRLIDPEEYWGWPAGIAIEAQVLKQADVLQLFALLDIFSPEVMRANYEYYEPRTEHGSSLSPSIHGLIATKAGLPAEAYRYFMEASTIDLYNASKKVMSGGEFLGGIHTAANGGVWLMLVRGFAGFEMDGETVVFKPAVPQEWELLTFKLMIRGNELTIAMDHAQVSVQSAAENPGGVTVRVAERSLAVKPGAVATFSAGS